MTVALGLLGLFDSLYRLELLHRGRELQAGAAHVRAGIAHPLERRTQVHDHRAERIQQFPTVDRAAAPALR